MSTGKLTIPPSYCTGPLVVGLSGGRDSVALLHLLAEQGCKLIALHVHHGIRGAEADGDADFCRKLCAQLKITYEEQRIDAPALAAESGQSLETAARLVPSWRRGRHGTISWPAPWRPTAFPCSSPPTMPTIRQKLFCSAWREVRQAPEVWKQSPKPRAVPGCGRCWRWR